MMCVYLYIFERCLCCDRAKHCDRSGNPDLFGVDVYLLVFWVCCQLLPLLWLVLT